MKKKKTITAALILATLLILAAVVLSVNLKDENITVSGNHQYMEKQIEELLFSGKWGRNFVLCLYKDRFQPHKEIPFIEEYKLVFQGIGKVQVIVYEKSMVGYISHMNSFLYFDKDGIIVESSNTELDGIPLITGLKFGHIVLHQKLPVTNEQIFDEILNLTQVLSSHNQKLDSYKIKVDRIQYDNRGNPTLYLGDIEVILGNNDQIDGKIATLGSMMPHLEGRAGILYLDTFDAANPGRSTSFIPSN